MRGVVLILAVSAAILGSSAGAQAVPPDATEVVIKGVLRAKPAPADPLPPLSIFVKPARIEQIAISPDGSQVAFTTHVDDQHLMAIYKVADESKRAIKLSNQTLTGVSWADNDHIILSAGTTGLRGTCPDGANQGAANRNTQISVRPAIRFVIPKGNDPAESRGDQANAVSAMSLVNELQTPGCVYYGVRSEEALTVVNLKDDSGLAIGSRMSELNNLALGTPQMVTVDGKAMMMGPYLELRGDSINRQPTQRVYLWQVDPETGTGKQIDDGGGDINRESRYVDDWLFDRHGSLLARTVYGFTKETFSIEMKAGKGWKPVLTQKIAGNALTFAPYLVGIGRDGQSIVIFAEDAAKPRHFHYYELNGDGVMSAPLEPGDALYDRPIFNPATGRLAGFVTHGEVPDYVLSDPDMARLYAAAQDSAPGQAVRVVATATDPRRMIIFTQGGDDAGGYYYLDLAKGSFVDLGNDYPSVPAEWVATQSPFSYKAADGTVIHALLTQPTKAEGPNLPLVVLPHDGPQGHDSIGYNWLAQALASRGYLVLQPNYRGSSGHGPDFTEAGNGEWGGRILSDIGDGVRDLTAQGMADPKRVCILGSGYGGYAALAGAVAGDGTYRCAAAIGGIANVEAYLSWNRINRPVLDPDRLGGMSADPEWPRAFQPATGSLETAKRYVGGADTAAISPVGKPDQAVPVLLINTGKDKDVPADQSRWMYNALRNAGKPVNLVDLDDCDHSLSTESCRLAAAEAVVDFLGTYNPAN